MVRMESYKLIQTWKKDIAKGLPEWVKVLQRAMAAHSSFGMGYNLTLRWQKDAKQRFVKAFFLVSISISG